MAGFVVDASVLVKLVVEESDTPKATRLMEHIQETRAVSKAPDLLVYEFLAASIGRGADREIAQTAIMKATGSLIELVRPVPAHWDCAFDIRASGTRKSGYPYLYDCIYHAIAIVEQLTFVTADERHLGKAKQFGSIALLSDLDLG